MCPPKLPDDTDPELVAALKRARERVEQARLRYFAATREHLSARQREYEAAAQEEAELEQRVEGTQRSRRHRAPHDAAEGGEA